MNNNDTNTKVQVQVPGHGLYEADAEVLSRAIEAVGSASITWLRQEAAGACGFNANFLGLQDAFDDLNRAQVLIAWIDSGNHTF
jgi:hypothetical protein